MKRLTCCGELCTTQEMIFDLETQQLSPSQILAFADFKFRFPHYRDFELGIMQLPEWTVYQILYP